MVSTKSATVEKLALGALLRCRERVIQAKKAPCGEASPPAGETEPPGITNRWKRLRGL